MITALTEIIAFPEPWRADPDGLLAVGGDLSVLRLIEAYRHGIFPWYNDDYPILWWTPDPRPILIPARLRVGPRFLRYLRNHPFELAVDADFQSVISACAAMERPGQGGTWLTDDMIRAYVRLHCAGYAHSVECRREGRLMGGIYGVAVGKAFFGESMFHRESQASKVAFAHLVWLLGALGYRFMDCQQATPHVMRFGAMQIPRREFTRLAETAAAMEHETEGWRSPQWWNDRTRRLEFLKKWAKATRLCLASPVRDRFEDDP